MQIQGKYLTLINSYYNWYQQYDVIENYELARVITPYGNGLSNNWQFTTTFDITDFEQILRDSVEIRCHYSGWSSGFSATLDFEFIEGTPPRNVGSIENIYNGGHSYVTSADFETNKLTAKKLLVHPNTTTAMVKMTTTGHGFDNNQVAAEFKPINYYLNIDGIPRFYSNCLGSDIKRAKTFLWKYFLQTTTAWRDLF